MVQADIQNLEGEVGFEIYIWNRDTNARNPIF